MPLNRRLVAGLTSALVLSAAVVSTAPAAVAHPRSGEERHPETQAGERLHELMMSGNQGMTRMHELMTSGNPGMARMHQQLMPSSN